MINNKIHTTQMVFEIYPKLFNLIISNSIWKGIDE
jgi:hypothetical protein